MEKTKSNVIITEGIFDAVKLMGKLLKTIVVENFFTKKTQKLLQERNIIVSLQSNNQRD